MRGHGGWLWRAVTIGLPALAAASVGAWAALHWGLSGFWALVGASKLAAVVGALLAWRRPRVHALAWDGQQWHVDGRAVRLQLMLDLGPWLLLHLRPADGAAALWLPLAASEAGPAWGPLRAAVYSRPSSAPPAPRPPEQQTP